MPWCVLSGRFGRVWGSLNKMMDNFTQLKGCKVLLRPFQLTDITTEYVAWLNDANVVKYSNQRFLTHTKSSCISYWRSFIDTPNLFLSVRTLEDGVAVGTMTAYGSIPHGTVDLGILIGSSSIWGMGVGKDAWGTLLSWLLIEKKIRKVTAGTLACNKAMIRVIEGSGMRCEAVRPNQEVVDGIPVDLLYYGIYGK